MRFLKNKILKANEALQKKTLNSLSPNLSNLSLSQSQISTPSSEEYSSSSSNSSPTCKPKSHKSFEAEMTTKKKRTRKPSSTKNLVINYGKAIASFAVSHLAVSYLEPILKREALTLQEFINFISQSKKTIGGIKSFRYLILTTEEDDERAAACKKVFREISMVFIKFFSVNWIMHGKVTHKDTYLKYRFKMLRRIQDPENFTYVKRRIYSKKQI